MRTWTKLALAVVVLSLAGLAFATAQEGDILFLKNKKYFIYTNPLRRFLDKNPDKLPKSDVMSTANWRGYVATWEVKEDRLLLADVTVLRSKKTEGGGFSTAPQSVMSALFPEQKEVVASWFTGHIIVPDGKLVHYVHMGYASTYEKYIILRVEEGAVTRQWAADAQKFAEFRDAQFAAFKKTEEYREALAQTTKEGGGMSAKENVEFLREFYSERYMSLIFDKPH